VTNQNPGLFIAFEGGDGAGKSTQAAELAAALESRGLTVRRTREPGGTPIGEKLRSLVLDHGHGHIDAHTEALIFAASRAAQQEVESVLGTGHDVTVTLVQGDASEGLLETAKGADLLVVGNRGRGAIKEALLGSTSGRVADHAQCPVVIVRAYPDA